MNTQNLHFRRQLLLGEHKLTAQKMRFSIKDFFSKWDQICRKLQIWSHLLKKSLMENFIFCAVSIENTRSFNWLIKRTYPRNSKTPYQGKPLILILWYRKQTNETHLLYRKSSFVIGKTVKHGILEYLC